MWTNAAGALMKIQLEANQLIVHNSNFNQTQLYNAGNCNFSTSMNFDISNVLEFITDLPQTFAYYHLTILENTTAGNCGTSATPIKLTIIHFLYFHTQKVGNYFVHCILSIESQGAATCTKEFCCQFYIKPNNVHSLLLNWISV